MAKLTKSQRAALCQKFSGRCAYCGQELGHRWHADHFEPVQRQSAWDSKKKKLVATGECRAAEHDNLENLMPACPACNIDKSVLSLEEWREKLQRSTDVLARNSPTYRHALRFGLVQETGRRVQFYFESSETTPHKTTVRLPPT